MSLEPHEYSTNLLNANKETPQKMEHVFETKEIVFWDPASVEPRPEMRFLEMLHYPNRPEPIKDENTLDDSSLSSWLSKVIKLEGGICVLFNYILIT